MAKIKRPLVPPDGNVAKLVAKIREVDSSPPDAETARRGLEFYEKLREAGKRSKTSCNG